MNMYSESKLPNHREVTISHRYNVECRLRPFDIYFLHQYFNTGTVKISEYVGNKRMILKSLLHHMNVVNNRERIDLTKIFNVLNDRRIIFNFRVLKIKNTKAKIMFMV